MNNWYIDFPKAWDKYLTYLYGDDIKTEYRQNTVNEKFIEHFGYFIEFFSQNGIEIERINGKSGSQYCLSKYDNNGIKSFMGTDKLFHDTPEEAVEKAFKILEER